MLAHSFIVNIYTSKVILNIVIVNSLSSINLLKFKSFLLGIDFRSRNHRQQSSLILTSDNNVGKLTISLIREIGTRVSSEATSLSHHSKNTALEESNILHVFLF